MAKNDLDRLRTVEELVEYQREVKGRLTELHREFAGLPFTDEAREEFAELQEETEEIDERVAELKERKQYIEDLEQRDKGKDKPKNTERPWKVQDRSDDGRPEDIYDLTTIRMNPGDPEVARQSFRDRALRAVEIAEYPDGIRKEEAQGQIKKFLDRDSADSELARRVLITGSRVYRSAFAKSLKNQPLSHEEQRALSLTGASGGFAVPFTLDPTILNTSNGVVNPWRQLARVIQINTDEWRGVSSTGVTASYVAEATEATDNAPTLAQPTISTERAHAFVPFSIEIGQDWGSLQNEMAELFRDAKDQLEAAKFATGTGTNEPFGVLTGTTTTVNAAAGQTFTLANLYSLVGALPPRYRPRGAFVGSFDILNRIRQFETTGGSASGVWVEGLQADLPGRLMGKPAYEASTMSATPATSAKFLLFGDFSRFVIVDRIGMNIELLPHLLGANRRPTGERGLYAYWRNGSKVVDANAFRALLGVA